MNSGNNTTPANSHFKSLPGVDTLLKNKYIKELIDIFGADTVKYFIREVLTDARKHVMSGSPPPGDDEVISKVAQALSDLTSKKLIPVINATGIVVHTNLGRAPYGSHLLNDVADVLSGYNNLEFNLSTADRGSRYVHVTGLLKFLTGAEDILIVNNNAAAVMLVLRTFSKNREVIVSRGELIEIGGSFRMPDIMKASDCIMMEVGTTNKTSIRDYENAVNQQTALLLKAHRSNYVIRGFTHEPSLEELIELGKQKKIPVFYDMGSGLLRKADIALLKDEPDVRSAIEMGVDLVSFSGDKLLGGPQAGIIAGRQTLIQKLKKEPMTRALRVDKAILALFESVCLSYLDNKKLIDNNPVFRMLSQKEDILFQRAERLAQMLSIAGIQANVVESFGQTGGGSLPEKKIKSYAVQLSFDHVSRKEKTAYAEKTYFGLLRQKTPVLGVLRKGNILFDVLTITDQQIDEIAGAVLQLSTEVING